MRHWISTCVLAAAIPMGAADLSIESLQNAKGFTWAQHKSANFDFFVESGGFADRDYSNLARWMEESRGRVEDLLGQRSPLRGTVFIVDSRARMKSLTGREVNAMTYGETSFAVYNGESKAVGAHETCHILSRALWGKPSGTWINEGLAVFSDNQWRGQPLDQVAKWLLDHGKLAPLQKLLKDGWQSKYSDMITYPELGSFVKFLYETFGREAVKTIWQRGPKNLDELELLWHVKLASVNASGVQYSL